MPSHDELTNQELDLLEELVDEAFSRLGLSDIQTPPPGEPLNRAGWLVNLKYRFLALRHERRLAGSYPLFLDK